MIAAILVCGFHAVSVNTHMILLLSGFGIWYAEQK